MGLVDRNYFVVALIVVQIEKSQDQLVKAAVEANHIEPDASLGHLYIANEVNLVGLELSIYLIDNQIAVGGP